MLARQNGARKLYDWYFSSFASQKRVERFVANTLTIEARDCLDSKRLHSIFVTSIYDLRHQQTRLEKPSTLRKRQPLPKDKRAKRKEALWIFEIKPMIKNLVLSASTCFEYYYETSTQRENNLLESPTATGRTMHRNIDRFIQKKGQCTPSERGVKSNQKYVCIPIGLKPRGEHMWREGPEGLLPCSLETQDCGPSISGQLNIYN